MEGQRGCLASRNEVNSSLQLVTDRNRLIQSVKVRHRLMFEAKGPADDAVPPVESIVVSGQLVTDRYRLKQLVKERTD